MRENLSSSPMVPLAIRDHEFKSETKMTNSSSQHIHPLKGKQQLDLTKRELNSRGKEHRAEAM